MTANKPDKMAEKAGQESESRLQYSCSNPMCTAGTFAEGIGKLPLVATIFKVVDAIHDTLDWTRALPATIIDLVAKSDQIIAELRSAFDDAIKARLDKEFPPPKDPPSQ